MASLKQLDERRYKITVSNGYRPDGRKVCKARTLHVPKRIPRRSVLQYVMHAAEELEKEFYTMEIEPDGNIVQKSKDYNRTGEEYEEAEPFLKKWKKNVLKKIRNQEKDPTKTQVTLWTAELSAAYKDHVVMKGGKYQGQYLSDVLKAEQEAAA